MLRLLFLSKESLWLDELASADFTGAGLSRALSAEPTNPPLYYVVLYLFRTLLGGSESALRFPSVLFGTLSILAVFRLGRLLGLEKAALIAAAWTGVSSFMIAYSQEARCFALLTFLVLTSTALFVELIEGRSKNVLKWAAYIVCTVAALYTHFYAVFYVTGQNLVALHYIIKRKLGLWRWVCCQVIIVLLFFPWLLQMLSTAQGHGQTRRYLLLKLPQSFFSLLFGDTIVPLDERAVMNIRATLFQALPQLIVCCLTALLLLLCLRHAARSRPAFIFVPLTIAVTPILIGFFLSFKVMMLDERYLSPSAPLFFLALAGAVEFAIHSNNVRQRVWATFSVLGVGAMLAFGLQNYYTNPRFGKEQWREVVALVNSKMSERDIVVFEPDYASLGWDYYSTRPPAALLKVFLRDESSVETFLSEHTVKLAAAPNVWYIRSHYESDRMRDRLDTVLNRKELFPFPRDKGIEVYQFSGPAPVR